MQGRRGAIANFNISVAITDEFMQAVKDNADFDLRNPRNGAVWKTVRARDLFAKIVRYAHHNGEPGALFIDAANRANPVPHLYELEATNPCVHGRYTGGYAASGWRQRRRDPARVTEICTVLGIGRVPQSRSTTVCLSTRFTFGRRHGACHRCAPVPRPRLAHQVL